MPKSHQSDMHSMHVRSWPGKIAIAALHCYKVCISPLLGAQCRFTPTCSTYALCAFERYGFLSALLLVCKRILKCHPFHPGGYDPL